MRWSAYCSCLKSYFDNVYIVHVHVITHLISLFTTQAGPIGNVVYPLSPQQKVSMMRNLEKMIHQALNNTDEVCHCVLYSKFISQHFTEALDTNTKKK